MMVPPPSAARLTCSPRRAKSADKIEGASSINLGLSGKIPKFYHAGDRGLDTLVRTFYNPYYWSPNLPSRIQIRMEVPMYVVLGASGNTGHIVAKNLLARQQKVRVVGRNAAHLQPHAEQGAEIFIGDVTDASALTKAFHQADSAYVMIPPNVTSDDPLAYEERVSDAIAAAVKNAGVKNVVALSSIGADKPKGTGPVIGLHNLEQKLN